MSDRWLVAMSGGVDSSVAAALLVREGFEVVGVTMDLGEASPDRTHSRSCCGAPEVDDARSVARALRIRHYTANYRERFHDAVVVPFVSEYLNGRTPIPCVACNRVLKFDVLMRRARALGAEGVATGHYARIAPSPDGRPGLYRAIDADKDQTYFLFDLPRELLGAIRFPLGSLSKPEVRAQARALRLVTADKPESQGICFIPDGDVRAALARLAPEQERTPGPIVDHTGGVLGWHSGAAGYTLGQRKGLGLSGGPWYVVEIDVPGNRVVVDRAQALLRREVHVDAVHWLDGHPPEEPVRVQVRHRHASESASVRPGSGRRACFVLDEPVWAPAAGQAAVVYDRADQRLLGGGWIRGSA